MLPHPRFGANKRGGSKPRDHRRCVNALATGEGNCPTVFVRTPRTVYVLLGFPLRGGSCVAGGEV